MALVMRPEQTRISSWKCIEAESDVTHNCAAPRGLSATMACRRSSLKFDRDLLDIARVEVWKQVSAGHFRILKTYPI